VILKKRTLSLPFWILIFSLLLFKISSKAADEALKTFKFSGDLTATVTPHAEDGADEIVFLKGGAQTPCRFKEEPGRSFFHSVEEVKLSGYAQPLLVSEWSLGAHGEKFNVFDPTQKENCSLTQIESGHPMTYVVEGDHLKFIKNDGAVQVWKPGQKTKAFH
jgi:hypothetical protein